MEPNANLRFQFDRAWQLRMNQRLDDALIAFAQLKDPVQAAANADYDLELKILSASLARARHEITLAQSTIAEVAQAYANAAAPLSSRLLVERGLNNFYLENYSAAFDDFLNVVARSASETNALLMMQATLNALLCTEYLGLSSRSLESNYEQARKKASNEIDVAGVDSQWQAYQIRRWWSLGEFNNIQLHQPIVWNQATYHVHYLKSLPFIDEKSLPVDDLADSMRSQPETYLRSYWLRTLTGQNRREDLLVHKISEFAERIYLWTWFWLTGREMQLEKIVPYIEQLLERMSELHLTQMDQEFISLSLGWIAIFSPHFENLKNRVVSQFSTQTKSTILPFIEYERLIQGCVESRLRGTFNPNDEFVKLVRLHPLHSSSGHHLSALLSALDDLTTPMPAKLKGLTIKIKQRLEEERDFQQSEIAVDLEKMTAVNKLTGEKITSEPICLALKVLREQNNVACADFVELAFRQKGYDDFLHSSRIFNLLARIRAFLPENLMVTKKSDRILTRGDWTIVKIKKDIERVQDQPRVAKVAATSVRLTKKHDDQALEKLTRINRARFNRKDVEKKLQLSRAAAHRLVREWIQNGLVESHGSGPSRKYTVSEKWRVMQA